MGGDDVAITTAEAASALRWWLESGVDAIVQDQPRNWFELPPKITAVPEKPVTANAPPPADLEAFRAWLATSADAPLAARGSKPVQPVGAVAARLMLIAEPPGREDAAAGRPIGGEAWQLAQRMLAAINIAEDEAYLANLSCFYSPGAKLSPDLLAQCADAARRHISLVRPQRLLLLGDGPAIALLGKPVIEARGHVHSLEGVRTVVTFHPRFLFDRPSEKARVWSDLLLLMEET